MALCLAVVSEGSLQVPLHTRLLLEVEVAAAAEEEEEVVDMAQPEPLS